MQQLYWPTELSPEFGDQEIDFCVINWVLSFSSLNNDFVTIKMAAANSVQLRSILDNCLLHCHSSHHHSRLRTRFQQDE